MPKQDKYNIRDQDEAKRIIEPYTVDCKEAMALANIATIERLHFYQLTKLVPNEMRICE
jgi:hypothetical protein